MIPYEFSVLRYCYDPLTQEFINVGIVVHSPTTRFLQAEINTNYGRASRMFGKIDGVRYRLTLRHIQTELDNLSKQLARGLLFDSVTNLDTSLSRILPIDDSSLRFYAGGTGISDDLSTACEKLYRRYVVGSETAQTEGRTSDDVWRVFRKSLQRLDIADRLQPKRIVARDYEYDFQHAWKNGIWNLYEPISFDLVDEAAIPEKANKWLGRSLSLSSSADEFKLVFLLGEPGSSRLRGAFRNAENILNRIPVEKEIFREHEAEAFAEALELQLKQPHSEQVA